MNTQNAVSETASADPVSAGAVGVFVGGLGLGVVSGVDVGGVGGPFVVGEVVDDGGGLVGVVGVVDDGSGVGGGPDVLLGAVLDAAVVELGGVVREGLPVGSGGELLARFSLPASGTVFGDESGPRVVYVTATDRRAVTGNTTGAGTAGGGDPYANTGIPNTGTPNPGAGGLLGGVGGLDKLVNVSLEVSVELGRTRVTLADVLDFDVGSTIELDRAAGAPVDIRVNDTLLAHGEVVLIDDEYAVRITAIVDPGHQT